jgi:hypothetical protein
VICIMQPQLLTFNASLLTQAQPVRVWARVTLYTYENAEKFYLLLDDGSVLDKQSAVKMFEFESEAARTAYLNERYPYSPTTDPALSPAEREAAQAKRESQRIRCKICEG